MAPWTTFLIPNYWDKNEEDENEEENDKENDEIKEEIDEEDNDEEDNKKKDLKLINIFDEKKLLLKLKIEVTLLKKN